MPFHEAIAATSLERSRDTGTSAYGHATTLSYAHVRYNAHHHVKHHHVYEKEGGSVMKRGYHGYELEYCILSAAAGREENNAL